MTIERKSILNGKKTKNDNGKKRRKAKRGPGRRRVSNWIRIDTQFTPEMAKALEDRIEKQPGVTKSHIIRAAVSEYLDYHPEPCECVLSHKLERAVQLVEIIIQALGREHDEYCVKREDGATKISLNHKAQLALVFGRWTETSATVDIATSLINQMSWDCIVEPVHREIPVADSKRRITEKVGFDFYIHDKTIGKHPDNVRIERITATKMKKGLDILIEEYRRSGKIGGSAVFV